MVDGPDDVEWLGEETTGAGGRARARDLHRRLLRRYLQHHLPHWYGGGVVGPQVARVVQRHAAGVCVVAA